MVRVITLTSLYNLDFLESHFDKVKLCVAGVYSVYSFYACLMFLSKKMFWMLFLLTFWVHAFKYNLSNRHSISPREAKLIIFQYTKNNQYCIIFIQFDYTWFIYSTNKYFGFFLCNANVLCEATVVIFLVSLKDPVPMSQGKAKSTDLPNKVSGDHVRVNISGRQRHQSECIDVQIDRRCRCMHITL